MSLVKEAARKFGSGPNTAMTVWKPRKLIDYRKPKNKGVLRSMQSNIGRSEPSWYK